MMYDGIITKPPIEELLCHFNQNHDPRNGQFTTGSGGISSSKIPKKKNLSDEYPGFSNDEWGENGDWIKLNKLVLKKSGDWYNSKGVSNGFKKYVKAYEKLSAKHENDKNKWALDSDFRKERDQLQDKLVLTVLDDIGYENNKKNREIIRNVLFWD